MRKKPKGSKTVDTLAPMKVLRLLHEAPQTWKALQKAFCPKNTPNERHALRRCLDMLIDEGSVAEDKDLYRLAPLNQKIARITWDKGETLAIPLDATTKIRIDTPSDTLLLPGDIVTVDIIAHHEEIDRGIVRAVKEEATVQVVGLFRQSRRTGWVRPLFRPFLNKTVQLIGFQEGVYPADGDMVVTTLLRKPGNYGSELIGECVAVLGDPDEPGIDIQAAIHHFDIPAQFPEAAVKAAKAFPKKVPKVDIEGREDLRKLPLVTIDGEDAKDFDDAVWCAPQKNGGWRLIVAIADVSHYVKAGHALDVCAQERGNSVYFPGHVVPMLPEALSNELCSLKPEVDRLAMVCDMDINATGKIIKSQFYEAVIRSHARLTYTQVHDYLNEESHAKEVIGELGDSINNLHALFNALLVRRQERGAIEFESNEAQIVLGPKGNVVSIVSRERNIAHRIIEECMLCANVCAAATLEQNEIAAPFRIHSGPTDDKLTELKASLAQFGLQLSKTPIRKILPKHLSSLLRENADRPDAALIQSLVLRSMSQAVYSPDNTGHFGLSYRAYLHFTSPIRRYPDLIVHRLLKTLIHEKQSKLDREQVEKMSIHCSMTERRAEEATRDAIKALKCRYLENHLGERKKGTIIGVTHFGLFVSLDDIPVDGLIHITEIGPDYYIHNPVTHTLVGEGSGERYSLGDSVTVNISAVCIEERKIDFTLVRNRQNAQKQRKRK